MKTLLWLVFLVVAACSGDSESPQEPLSLAWSPVAEERFDDLSGHTQLIELPTSPQRQTLRISSAPTNCYQLVTAIDPKGAELARPFTQSVCTECQWRTSVIQGAGLLVLEGPAAELTALGFGRVDCATQAASNVPPFSDSAFPDTDRVIVESLITELPSNPGLALRLALSQAMDIDLLADFIAFELGVHIEIASVETIPDADILLHAPIEKQALQGLLDQLPPRDEGIVDVVIGPCLQRQDAFGVQRLAGITPRIPGGAGVADAVFVARRICGSRHEEPDDPEHIARLVAHELGHYLGLHHPEELDGTLDDLPSTDTANLMHREPLSANATGLTQEQRDRMLAHPFVRNF